MTSAIDAVIPNVHRHEDADEKTGRTIDTMPGPERCANCRSPMCRCPHCHRPAGWVRHEARGLCKNCYVRSRPYRRDRPSTRKPRAPLTIDHAVITLALTGHQPAMNRAERAHVVDYLTRHRATAREIAERLGCTARTVVRHRAYIRGQQLEQRTS